MVAKEVIYTISITSDYTLDFTVVFQDIMIIYTTLVYTHLFILWICLFSFNDFTKRKMEHRVCDTVKVYTATELKDIRMKVETR